MTDCEHLRTTWMLIKDALALAATIANRNEDHHSGKPSALILHNVAMAILAMDKHSAMVALRDASLEDHIR